MTLATPGIYRAQLSFEQGFTRIPNTWLRDHRIGFRAKGLLAYLLSHEVGYTITLGQIGRETGDGKHAVRSAIDELVEAGYLITQRTHDARGWNAGLAWFLQDPNPKSENPTLENPTLENQTALEDNYLEKKTTREVNAQGDLERGFEEWWTFYPRKTGKHAALRAYAKAVAKIGAEALLEGARRLSSDPNLPPKQFIPHPATWLNEGRWEDEPYPERILSPEEAAAKAKAIADQKREAERRASEALRAEWAKSEAEAAPAPRCVHGHNLALCLPCIRAGNVGIPD